MDKHRECERCGCAEFYIEMRGQNEGIFCCSCEKWVKWIKQNNTDKTSEDYKREFMEKESPTESQVNYLKKLKYYGQVLSKYHASIIINAIVQKNDTSKDIDLSALH